MTEISSIVPVSRCPHCGLSLDAFAWRDNGHSPEPDDLTICQGCAHILRFGRHLKLIALTERDERAMHRSNPDIFKAVQAIARRLLSQSDLAIRRTIQ